MNKAILVGRLATEIEVRSTKSGNVAQFRVAVNRPFTNAQGQREADFLSCVAWNQRADYLTRYGRKGDRIAVEGRIQARTYDAQDGSKRYITEIICENVELLGGRREGAEAGAASQQSAGSGQEQRAQQQRMNFARPESQMDAQGFTEVEDDELPF